MLDAQEQLTQLQARNAQLLAQIEQLEQQRECDCRTRDERIEALIEQMRLLKAQLFGRSSEKRTIDAG